MFLGGVSYIVYYFLVRREFRKIAAFEELWLYIFLVTGATILVTLILYTGTDRDLTLSFRHGFFQSYLNDDRNRLCHDGLHGLATGRMVNHASSDACRRMYRINHGRNQDGPAPDQPA